VDESKPIFVQIAEQLENDILSAQMTEESQVPSTNELAAFYRINPATALKGITLLVENGIVYKKRGIGMFVAVGARDRIVAERREQFAAQFVQPLVAEASKLGISASELADMIRKENQA